jgi:hypothetical protein
MSSASMGKGGPPPASVVATVTREETRAALDRGLAHVQRSWMELAAPSRRTGAYLRSIHPVIVPLGPVGWSGSVVATVPYAQWLEEGTGIYGPRHEMIRSTGGGVLRFPEPGNRGFTLSGRQRSGRAGRNARYVFASSVRGIRPRHYGRDAVLASRAAFDAEIQGAGERIAARIEEHML